MKQTNAPFRQSCAMPMEAPEMFGTCADGSQSEACCTYCFRNGRFTDPDISMQDMIDTCAVIMSQRKIIPEDRARELLEKTIPSLNRWRTT